MPDKNSSKSEVAKKIILHPSLLWHSELILALFVSTFIYIYSAIYYPWSVQQVTVFGLTFNLPMLGIFPIMIIAVLLVRHFNYKYVISHDHVRSLSGILSTKMLDRRLDMHHIRGVEIDRSILGRLFNIGDVEIGSVNHGNDDIVMFGLYNPEKYRKLIESRVSNINDVED